MTKAGVSETFGLKREVCPLIHIHCKPKSKFSYLTKNQKNYNFIKVHLAVCGHYRQNRQNYHKKLDLDKKSLPTFSKRLTLAGMLDVSSLLLFTSSTARILHSPMSKVFHSTFWRL